MMSAVKVLCISQNPELAENMVQLLEEDGYEVRVVRDMDEAMHALRATQGDYIISSDNISVLGQQQGLVSLAASGIPYLVFYRPQKATTRERTTQLTRGGLWENIAQWLAKPLSSTLH